MQLNHHHPGGHNIKQQERTQQAFGVRRAIRHPGYNPENFSNDIMLLQLERKAKQTAAMRQLRLPRAMACTKPGQTCSGAGWGKDSREGTCPHSLQEVKLTTQEDQMCEFYLHYYYTIATQLCTGDPKTKKASFKMLIWEKANNMSCARETDNPRDRGDLRCLMERNQHAQ
uniref:Uncharacterized protein n=1 Tax=Ovis aries TaxID=9940 RepID=A0AC11CSB7_SHEEP